MTVFWELGVGEDSEIKSPRTPRVYTVEAGSWMRIRPPEAGCGEMVQCSNIDCAKN